MILWVCKTCDSLTRICNYASAMENLPMHTKLRMCISEYCALEMKAAL